MNKLVSQIYNKDSNRDAQLMQVIREIQETKRMVAASKEQSFFQSFKSLFSRAKQEKQMNKQYKIKSYLSSVTFIPYFVQLVI